MDELNDAFIGKATSLESIGHVSGSAFRILNSITFENGIMVFLYGDGTEEKITHDMVKCATILAMGVDGEGNKIIKYLCAFKDGRQAILTIDIDNCTRNATKVENVIF